MKQNVVQFVKKGRQPTPDGRRCFDLYPFSSDYPGRHWLYVLGFEGGGAKFGMTQNPRLRLMRHWTDYGGLITWAHLFRSFEDKHLCGVIERRAVALACDVGLRYRNTERFDGIDRRDAISCVRRAVAEHSPFFALDGVGTLIAKTPRNRVIFPKSGAA